MSAPLICLIGFGEVMREAAIGVREAGLTPWMSSACAERQDWAAARCDADAQPSLNGMFDAILAACPT
jgi:hypothetical protein